MKKLKYKKTLQYFYSIFLSQLCISTELKLFHFWYPNEKPYDTQYIYILERSWDKLTKNGDTNFMSNKY